MNKPSEEDFRYRLVRGLRHPRLPLALALVSTLLALPCLWAGFHLDDHVHRYLLSDLPGSERLLRAYESPFGIANGEPEIIRWQIENGYAPWWTYDRLLISLWRPLGELSHRLDYLLWPSNAAAMHAHSLLCFMALVFAVTALFRRILGPGTVAGLAGVLYAVDHTHGFAVGWIANRNVLIAALFGALALHAHHRWRAEGSMTAAVAAPLLLLCGLFSGEAAVAVLGYLFAHALFLESGKPPSRRAMSLLPCTITVVAWRIGYNLLGRGAIGSGLYIDPVREPFRFAAAALERLPVLALGQYALPPAELYLLAPGNLAAAIWFFSLLFLICLLAVAIPLLLRDPHARFWALGMFCALLPACTTHPNNRLLFFAGLGAMGLLSQIWHGLVDRADWLLRSRAWRMFAHYFIAAITGFHLLVSPLLLPLSACSILLTSPVERSIADIYANDDASDAENPAGKDLVIINSPDYYFVKLLPVLHALQNRPRPRRLRALGFGPVPLFVTRAGSHTLSISFKGGILQNPIMELYRDADIPMQMGQRIEMEGLRIQVTAITPDGRASRALFSFDADLNDERFQWLQWKETRYVPFTPPAKGATVQLAPARIPFGL